MYTAHDSRRPYTIFSLLSLHQLSSKGEMEFKEELNFGRQETEILQFPLLFISVKSQFPSSDFYGQRCRTDLEGLRINLGHFKGAVGARPLIPVALHIISVIICTQ